MLIQFNEKIQKNLTEQLYVHIQSKVNLFLIPEKHTHIKHLYTHIKLIQTEL